MTVAVGGAVDVPAYCVLRFLHAVEVVHGYFRARRSVLIPSVELHGGI